MCPRSQTSGLMIGECTRSSSSSLEVGDQRERPRARLLEVDERSRKSAGLSGGGRGRGGGGLRVGRAMTPLLYESPFAGHQPARVGVAGEAASSTITLRRSRRRRLAGTWRLGSASIGVDRIGLAGAGGQQQAARGGPQHSEAERDPLRRGLGGIVHAQAQRMLTPHSARRRPETARRRARPGRSPAR